MKAFADTNVLIYATLADDARKQGIAQRLLAARPTVSTQVLAEAYSVLTRKKQWPAAEAVEVVNPFEAALGEPAPAKRRAGSARKR